MTTPTDTRRQAGGEEAGGEELEDLVVCGRGYLERTGEIRTDHLQGAGVEVR